MNPHPKPAHTHGHHPPHATQRAGRGSSRKVTNNLVALGSAAVLAVYAAGFIRTRNAAQRFEGDGGGRRQPLSTKQVANVTPTETPAVVTPSADPIAPPVALAPAAEATTTSTSAVITTSTPTPTPAATEPTPAPVVVTAVEPWVPAAATLPVPPPPLAAPASVAPAAPVNAISTAPAAKDTAAAAVSKPSIWKDGKYSGWGSCRHGDIGATVEITDGRIVSAIISSCRTVYSCDVIDKVIPQVVTRQSADIDSVSGATQSADAFFWAVSSALDDAKAALASTKAALTTAK